MQHLFNRIYLAPLYQAEERHDDGAVIFITDNQQVLGILRSQTCAYDADETTRFAAYLQETRFTAEVGELVHFSPSYQEMLRLHYQNNETNFFQFLIKWPADKRLTIYGDLPQMERILTAWLKTALPNLSRDEGHKLLRLISLREKLMYKNHKPSVPIAVDREHTLKQSRGEQKLNFTYDGNIWNNINKFPIDVKTNIGVVGLEFLLATYLWNRLANRPNDQWAGGAIVEDRVTRFVKKTLTAMLFDSKDTIVSNLHNTAGLFGVEFDITDPVAVETFAATNQQHRWLFDDEFVPSNYQYVWSTYDVASVYQTSVQLILTIDAESSIHDSHKATLLTKVFKTNFTMDDVLEVEADNHFSNLIFGTDATDKVLNRYLIDYILDLYKRGDSATLKQLTV